MNARHSSNEIIERENLSKGIPDGYLLIFSNWSILQRNSLVFTLAFFLLSLGTDQAQSNSSASSNAAGISTSNDVANAPRIFPMIDSVSPNPAPALALPHALVVNGAEFRQNCEVVVRDKKTGEAFRNFKFALHHDNQFVITPNFDKSEGKWSIEVINPGGFSSSEFIFDVVAPEHLSAWFWWRSGWPWFWASVAFILVSGVGVWFNHIRERAAVALARDEGRRKEHERMSRDYHDSVNSLNQVKLLAEKIEVMTQNHAGDIRATASSISSAVIEAVNGLEDIIWASAPGHENLEPLVARLCRKIERFREINPDLNTLLDFPFDVPAQSVSTEFCTHLLRITSEALRNIVKHANASEVRCKLLIQADLLHYEIMDNGRGFQLGEGPDTGHGLPNLRRRAGELGGSLLVCAKPGAGTRIVIEIPFKKSPNAGQGD